jgi:exopolysaccharide biosynthesis polyprenyl glycosylphosphotransferase
MWGAPYGVVSAGEQRMTPPPAVTEVATPLRLPLPADEPRSPTLARALEPRWWSRGRFLVDATVLSLAAVAAVFGSDSVRFSATSRLVAGGFPLLVLVLLYVRRAPDDRLSQSAVDIFSHVLGIVSLAGMLAIAAGSVLGVAHPLTLPLRLWVFALVYLSVARLVMRSVRHHALTYAAFSTPTLIVGAGIVGQQLTHRLLEDRSYGLRPVGLIDADPLPNTRQHPAAGVPVLGGLSDLVDAIIATGARQLIVAFSAAPDSLMIERLEECRRMGISVLLVPRLYELMNERSTLDHLGGVPVVTLRTTDPRGWEFAVKHGFDRAFAAAALIVFGPLMLALALLVRVSSTGPILFRQRRVGRDGREFDLLKFRSMRVAAPSAPQFEVIDGMAPGGVEGVDRRTPVGRFLRTSSLDELPQLLNVLRGEMSIVGPRPERPAFVEQFVAEVDRYDRRHRVKAGITGWAQVRGLRGQTPISDRVEWDNFYIQNWSLWLDVKILALTFAEVFRFRG